MKKQRLHLVDMKKNERVSVISLKHVSNANLPGMFKCATDCVAEDEEKCFWTFELYTELHL